MKKCLLMFVFLLATLLLAMLLENGNQGTLDQNMATEDSHNEMLLAVRNR